MNIPNKIKQGRGRPRKSNIKPQEQQPEPIIVETPPEPIIEDVPIVETTQVVKKVRRINQWVEHCTEVKNRDINVGKSYREILKIAKLDYQK